MNCMNMTSSDIEQTGILCVSLSWLSAVTLNVLTVFVNT